MKQITDVARVGLIVPDSGCSLKQRLICQRTQKMDGVEEIRLARPVCPCDAGEGAEADVDINQVLESVDLKSRQHDAIPLLGLAPLRLIEKTVGGG